MFECSSRSNKYHSHLLLEARSCLHAQKVYTEDVRCWWMRLLFGLIKQRTPSAAECFCWRAAANSLAVKLLWGIYDTIKLIIYAKLHSYRNSTFLSVFPWAAFLRSLIDMPSCAFPGPIKYKTMCFSYYVPNLYLLDDPFHLCFQCSSSATENGKIKPIF